MLGIHLSLHTCKSFYFFIKLNDLRLGMILFTLYNFQLHFEDNKFIPAPKVQSIYSFHEAKKTKPY